MKRYYSTFIIAVFCFLCVATYSIADDRIPVYAVGIPLADHYAGIIAYEKYRHQMKTASFHLKLLPGPELVRAYFFSEPDVDMAFNVCPMVMDMFSKKPIFRWISLIHRDGNALAINKHLYEQIDLPIDKRSRLPDERIANAIKTYRKRTGEPVRIGIPSLLATHTTVLYAYLKKHDITFGFRKSENVDVVLDIVKPPDSPVYLKKQNARSRHAAFEQSLPWPEVAETKRTGYISWYSKDILHHEQGHVECVIIARNESIETKHEALQEVIKYIHISGRDIETARRKGGPALEEIVIMIRKHIPAHSREAIIQTLRSDLNAINYAHLNVDDNAKSSFRRIMAIALEAGFIEKEIDIEQLVDDSFNTEITDQGE
nr:ABC transporter substrate-binding protein [uncultured Desulfobacter sp.]